jgi:hypothetical protein
MNPKSPFLNRFEEKFVFRISRTVWHGFVVVAIVGMAGGLGVLGWSALPASQRTVTKEAYPAPISVTFAEIQQALKPAAKQVVTPAAAKPGAAKKKQPKPAASKEQVAYQQAMAKLKALFPGDRYHWSDVMGWDYPYGEFMWAEYQDAEYRKWIVKEQGVETWVKRQLNDLKGASFGDKAQVLQAYVAIVAKQPVQDRFDVMRPLGRMTAQDAANSVARIEAIGAVLAPLSQDRPRMAWQSADFLMQDAGGTIEALEYFGGTISRFAASARLAALDVLFSAYADRFDKDLTRERDLVDAFVPMLGKVAPANQAKGLTTYFDLYAKKNADHQAATRAIDERYASAVSQAEQDFNAEKAAKESSRLMAVYAVAGGIGLTAMVALLLVLLSIQRYLKTIAERLGGDQAMAAEAYEVEELPPFAAESVVT